MLASHIITPAERARRKGREERDGCKKIKNKEQC